jgi:hypothetical protein
MARGQSVSTLKKGDNSPATEISPELENCQARDIAAKANKEDEIANISSA